MSVNNLNDTEGELIEQSTLKYHSSSLPSMPNYYNRSMVAPLKLIERKSPSRGNASLLSKSKQRSTMQSFLILEETAFPTPTFVSKEKNDRMMDKLNCTRIHTIKLLEAQRHAHGKTQLRKNQLQHLINDQNEQIEQLMSVASEINAMIDNLNDEISKQRRSRDQHEMRQLKIKRLLSQYEENDRKSAHRISGSAKRTFLEQYESKLLELKKNFQQQIDERDAEIQQLKQIISGEYHIQTDEYSTLIRATERAIHLESQKRDLLQQSVNSYELNASHATKPCCTASSHRLNKLSSQLRIYSMIELALHELFHSSCPCGKFQRAYETFLRLHNQ